MCFSEAYSPPPSFLQSPVVCYVNLRPCGLLPIHIGMSAGVSLFKSYLGSHVSDTL